MITSITFCSRREFEGLVPANIPCVISIGCPDQKPPPNLARWAEADRLRLGFLDLEDDTMRALQIDEAEAVAHELIFTEAMAEAVWQFAQGLANRPEAVQLVIHCEAGASRSAAVASALAGWQGLPLTDDISGANTRVLRILAATAPVI